MRVLFAGDRGYIGAVLVPCLQAAGPEVDGLGVRDGIHEILSAYTEHGLTYDAFLSSRFVRLRRIRELLSVGLVDEMLPSADHRSAPLLTPGAGFTQERQ